MQKQFELALSCFIKNNNQSKSYIKAQDYRNEISNIEIDKNIIRASVRGTHLYKVTLKLDKDIHSYCTCQVDFETCKHTIALAIHMKNNVHQYLEAECDKLEKISKNKKELNNLTKANLILIIDQLIGLNKSNEKYFSSLMNEPNTIE